MKSSQLFVILFLLFVAKSTISEQPMEIFIDEPQLCLYTACRGQSYGVMPCEKGYINCGTRSCFITGLDPGKETICCTKCSETSSQ